MFYLVIRSLALILFKIYFRLEILGRKNVPSAGGFVLAANHVSYLDPPAVAAACPRKLSFLAKERLFRNVLFGRFISALNSFPIKTNTGDLKALRWAIGKLKAGQAVLVFPEGGRIVDGELQQAQRGVGLLAVKANVPIVPAFIKGSEQAMPVHSKFIHPKRIKVYFGRPIWPEGLKQQLKARDFYQSIAEKTMQEIGRLKDNSY